MAEITIQTYGLRPVRRTHIVMVPGFVGFDALGQLEYYAGVTQQFRAWNESEADHPVALHYFDNFPTASVALRAGRLREYLAKRIVRGEFAPSDRVALVGHSTGALDIRKAVYDLARSSGGDTVVDSGCRVENAELLDRISQLVFLSAPHFGTNLADFACRLDDTLQGLLKDAGLALQLNRDPVAMLRRASDRLVNPGESGLLLALRDALSESDEDPKGDDVHRAGEREARAQLALWLDHMGKDFNILADLRSAAGHPSSSSSPAHFSPDERAAEMALWRRHRISTTSYVTLVPRNGGGNAASLFLPVLKKGAPVLNALAWLLNGAAERWWLQPISASAVVLRALVPVLATPAAIKSLSQCPELVFALFQGLCADPSGPFRNPNTLAPDSIAPSVTLFGSGEEVPSAAIEVADSDGVVNTQSMLWPYEPDDPARHPHYLVEADHGDIIGHYRLALREHPDANGRMYGAYDIFPSGARFGPTEFERVWTDVFAACAANGA